MTILFPSRSPGRLEGPLSRGCVGQKLPVHQCWGAVATAGPSLHWPEAEGSTGGKHLPAAGLSRGGREGRAQPALAGGGCSHRPPQYQLCRGGRPPGLPQPLRYLHVCWGTEEPPLLPRTGHGGWSPCPRDCGSRSASAAPTAGGDSPRGPVRGADGPRPPQPEQGSGGASAAGAPAVLLSDPLPQPRAAGRAGRGCAERRARRS